MPNRLARACRVKSCPNLTRSLYGYCTEHERQRQSKYNRDDRVGRYMYGSTWRKLRTMILNQSPLCVACQSVGIIKEAQDVDHIIPWKTGETLDKQRQLFFDRKNLQTLCHACHSAKTYKENLEDSRCANEAPTPIGGV